MPTAVTRKLTARWICRWNGYNIIWCRPDTDT